MTAVDLTPYWTAADDWTGFLLMIVPVGRLPVPASELCRQVRAQIETDAVLYDLVTVALAPPFAPTTDWHRGFVTSVVEAAMPDRHFFAPRGVIGAVVVAADKRGLNDAFDFLLASPAEHRLWVRLFGIGVRPDSRTGVSGTSVLRIADTVNKLIETYGEQPLVAAAESTFLEWLGTLIEERQLSEAALVPVPVGEQPAELATQVTRPVRDARSTGDARSTEHARSTELSRVQPAPQQRAELTSMPARVALPSPEPAPVVEPPAAERPVAQQPPRRLLEPVMYEGAEVVVVDQRTPIQRLTGRNPTDADCMNELERDGRAVGLVCLVFVPDDGIVSRSVAKRRNMIALELDQAFASVQRDAATGQPARVAVEVLSATNPVQKHGVLRTAGEMTEAAIPKIKIEYFSVTEVAEPLLDASERISRALRARGVDVVSLHFVFLAAMRFPVDETTEEDWNGLLEHGRVTWIDFSPADRRQSLYPIPPSPFGLHVLTDKEDVVSVIKKQSEVIYGYAPPPVSDPTPEPDSQPEADGEPATSQPTRARRRWGFGKRPT
jgi:hypothetical protein